MVSCFFGKKTAAGQNQLHLVRLTGSEHRGNTGGGKPIYSLHYKYRSRHLNNYILKLSDTIILSLLTQHRHPLLQIRTWRSGESHNLILNVLKTKEMNFDPEAVGDHSVVSIKRQEVEQVLMYKYLRIYFDSLLQ